MKMVQCAALTALVVFQAGCGVSEPEGVHIVSTESPSVVVAGDSVVMATTVANGFSQPISLLITAKSTYEVTVTDSDGLVVWIRFDFPRANGIYETIAPGEVRTFEAVWYLVDRTGAPVARGTYFWTGTIGEIVSTSPQEIEVRARP